MAKMQSIIRPIIIAIIALTFAMCSKDVHRTKAEPALPDTPIVILYDNDVHCAVDGYAVVAAQRKAQETTTPYVSTVSCGDFASGNIVGMISQGESVVEIMNAVGYDVVVLGNHELDYGMTQMFKLTDALEASVVCANLINCQTYERPYPAYEIISYGDVDIAYIGFTTTTSGTTKKLSDENGCLLYSFMREDFYRNAQSCIDDAREEGADYVVALAHLGDTDRGNGHANSLDLIAHTTGLDAVIDGHDHHIIGEQMVANKDGNAVLLTSSGTAFQYMGKLVLTPQGNFQSSLIDIQGAEEVDEEIKNLVDEIKEQTTSDGEKVVGYNEADLSIYDAEGVRIVRTQETTIGNFLSDAIRAYTKSDVAMLNGGGIRADLKRGDITYNDLYAVMPFSNYIHTATMTGQQLLDALEFSVSFLPNEDGVFMQVSGMKFKVDSKIASPVVKDAEHDIFSYVGEGERRVSNLQIWDYATQTYKPVDLSDTYTISSFDYLISELGGDGIFRYAQPLDKYWGLEVEGAVYYIQEVLQNRIGAEYAQLEGRIVIR